MMKLDTLPPKNILSNIHLNLMLSLTFIQLSNSQLSFMQLIIT